MLDRKKEIIKRWIYTSWKLKCNWEIYQEEIKENVLSFLSEGLDIIGSSELISSAFSNIFDC